MQTYRLTTRVVQNPTVPCAPVAFSLLPLSSSSISFCRPGQPFQRCQAPSSPRGALRFDVRERVDAFELQGELPGFTREDVSVEFADASTLVIRARVERGTTKLSMTDNTTTVSTTVSEAGSGEKEKESDSESQSLATVVESHEVEKRGYRKATVEDDYVDAGAEESEGEVVDTPATTVAGEAIVGKEEEEEEKKLRAEETQKIAEREKYRYLLTERATGDFVRRFKFAMEVDRGGVRAELKDGVLRIEVPKVARRERRIVVA